jgi:catechol 2,3-dioxygenase-like lactoylglutathione lyase family enzyme
MIGTLGMVMVLVSDMERSLAFYRDVLGLPVVEESPAWSELDAGTIHVGLHHVDGEGGLSAGEGGSVQLTFYVEDAAAAVARLRDGGADIATEPTQEGFGGIIAVVNDPDGYPIQLLQNG